MGTPKLWWAREGWGRRGEAGVGGRACAAAGGRRKDEHQGKQYKNPPLREREDDLDGDAARDSVRVTDRPLVAEREGELARDLDRLPLAGRDLDRLPLAVADRRDTERLRVRDGDAGGDTDGARERDTERVGDCASAPHPGARPAGDARSSASSSSHGARTATRRRRGAGAAANGGAAAAGGGPPPPQPPCAAEQGRRRRRVPPPAGAQAAAEAVGAIPPTRKRSEGASAMVRARYGALGSRNYKG
jgi:hypothetical protein